MHIDFENRPALPPEIPQGALVYEPTELQSVTFCGYKYYLEYVRGIHKPYTSLPLFHGIIGHQILSQGVDYFDDIFYAGVEFYKKHESPLCATDEDIKKLYDTLKIQITNFERIAQQMGLDPVAKEVTGWIPVEVPWPVKSKGITVYIVGTADLYVRCEQGPEGSDQRNRIDILDYKFGRRPPVAQLNRNFQFGCYYLMARRAGYEVDNMIWTSMGDFLEYKKKGPKTGAMPGDLKGPGFYPVQITDDDAAIIIEQAIYSIKAIEAGAWTKHSNYASQPCNFCEFESVCPKFKVGYKESEEM